MDLDRSRYSDFAWPEYEEFDDEFEAWINEQIMKRIEEEEIKEIFYE